ncbi:winged helix-turn-helix domain-containing protein (plasmid) [Alicyclobacillus fastidiosus]|uniref:Winged helix-turn-helix domain-containing protein n=1 Tax=Alicyclobacillus fastidiosus TaxID=392011 RepID=A0ABY6ZPR0_9BACL|nr:helix-turn-helix domain-containing protein [Alicyclobacillus fastidiosus]WAH44869.1 winged helix-turn-helix domain-containing protein [Alicyclobacillus fastidiosus]GMA65625.1 hypothetical protein GCM10025859_60650 [Alicyclobacillus fastidiosus]GMA65843.1 hypothetical protein GCM10025859_62830 [Alicyclobacillus fastidiosus]
MHTNNKLILGDYCLLDIHRGMLIKNGIASSFSKSETLILQCLAKRIGQPTSKMELIDYVWGKTNHPTERLLYQIIHRIRTKLEANVHEPKYLIAVRGFGYMLSCPYVQEIS